MKRSATFAALAITCATAFGARPASAQLGWTVYGTGEFDTQEVIYALAGVALSPSRLGFVPVFDLQGWYLQYPAGNNENQRVLGVTPSIGLARNYNGGMMAFRVGYALTDGDVVNLPPGITADVGGDGVTNTVHLEHWGSGRLGLQGIGSYNYGSETLWARARATHRVMGYGSDGQIRVGAEVAYLDTPTLQSIQPGILVGFQPSIGTTINLGVGLKLNDVQNATYFKAELVLTPSR